jgi:hypothetical protein
MMEVLSMVEKSPFGSQSDPDDGSGDVCSLEARALKAARAELRGERAGILGAVGLSSLLHLKPRPCAPRDWSWSHIIERMEEAFRTLRRLPAPTGPRGYRNSMPRHDYDRGDLNGQQETYELERMAKLRNRVRLHPPPDEITRMEEAMWWPTKYIKESRKLQERRHADNSAALRDLAEKLDRHAASVETMRPTVAALELSRSKLATWATAGFAIFVVFGWLAEAALKWLVDRALSHFQ